MAKEQNTCASCGKQADELCPDGYCRGCHVSVTWEDCCTKTFNARILLSNGHSREEILKLYPEARI